MSKHVPLGFLEDLPEGSLPTSLSIFNFSLKACQNLKKETGRQNIPNNDIVTAVFSEVKVIWGKTDIPNLCDSDPHKVKKKIDQAIQKGRKLRSMKIERRGPDFGNELRHLLDLSLCQHPDSGSCNCPAASKVPAAWRSFLLDQRGPRLQGGQLSRSSLALRNADSLQVGTGKNCFVFTVFR